MISDVLHDAVTEIDNYLRDGTGSAWPGHHWHPSVVAIRNLMEDLRCSLDDDPERKSYRRCPRAGDDEE